MSDLSPRITERLRVVAREALSAEERGDWDAVDAAWTRYRLIEDAGRDPDELLAEGIALSRFAISLASGS